MRFWAVGEGCGRICQPFRRAAEGRREGTVTVQFVAEALGSEETCWAPETSHCRVCKRRFWQGWEGLRRYLLLPLLPCHLWQR